MLALLIRWLVLTLAVILATQIVPGFTVTSTKAAFLTAVVLSLLNVAVRPVLFLLTLPVNILSLGLFTLVLNGFMLWLTAALLPGVGVRGIGTAILGAIIISVVSTLINWIAGSSRPG